VKHAGKQSGTGGNADEKEVLHRPGKPANFLRPGKYFFD
jgi:hypothetical protein